MDVVIYTDGGADPNPGVGGWAAILRYGSHERVLTGNSKATTNNRMELTAAVEALKALSRSCHIHLHTDSEYLKKGITEWIEKWIAKDWKRKGKDIPNTDLWKLLWKLTQQHDIEWHWVRGHSGNRFNERVDRLARKARLAISQDAPMPDGVPVIYVRASCKGNPGPGGWGVVMEIGDQTEQISGSEARTTNNRMELTAAIEGLRLAMRAKEVVIVTLSDYLFQGATKWIHGWRAREWKKRDGQPVSNLDLWQTLEGLSAGRTVHWRTEKGKASELSKGLVEASKLATSALDLERH